MKQVSFCTIFINYAIPVSCSCWVRRTLRRRSSSSSKAPLCHAHGNEPKHLKSHVYDPILPRSRDLKRQILAAFCLCKVRHVLLPEAVATKRCSCVIFTYKHPGKLRSTVSPIQEQNTKMSFRLRQEFVSLLTGFRNCIWRIKRR